MPSSSDFGQQQHSFPWARLNITNLLLLPACFYSECIHWSSDEGTRFWLSLFLIFNKGTDLTTQTQLYLCVFHIPAQAWTCTWAQTVHTGVDLHVKAHFYFSKDSSSVLFFFFTWLPLLIFSSLIGFCDNWTHLAHVITTTEFRCVCLSLKHISAKITWISDLWILIGCPSFDPPE